jgi:hypothetical protein
MTDEGAGMIACACLFLSEILTASDLPMLPGGR